MDKYGFAKEFYHKNNGAGIYPYVNGIIKAILNDERMKPEKKIAEMKKVFELVENLEKENGREI